MSVSSFGQRKVHRHPPLEKYNFQLLPQYRDALFEVIRTDFTITMRDGVTIDALKFVPNVPAPNGGWPTVIMVHGYGDSKETLAGFCRAQAEYGYYTMTFSMRGQGNSGGLSNLISITEARDFAEVVSWVKNDSANGSSPNNILVMGGSQGGAIPFMAASNQLTSVRTIISALAPANFASNWIENGCIKMTFLWTIEYTPDTARYTPLVDRMSDWVYADTKQYWDSLAYWLPIERDFMNQVPNCTTPILIEGSWQDKFFNASGLIQSLSNLNAPYISYIGAVLGHGGDTSTAENQWHMQLFNDWFFYWLFNTQNGIMNLPKYQFASSIQPKLNNQWNFLHDSSRTPLPQITSNLRLYFNKNGRLKLSPQSGSNNNVVLRNRISGGLTMLEAVNEEFTGPVFNSKFQKAVLTFTSDPLITDQQWVGTPRIKMDYKSSCNDFCQFNFQVYEVNSSGQTEFINRLNYTDRNYVRNSRRTCQFDGAAHSHVFKAGSRIRIVLTNLDTTPSDSSFLATNPFVLPVLRNGDNTFYLNSNSYIDIPIKNLSGAPLVFALENEPGSFILHQNYPNPFNPVTTISFYLSKPAKVDLKVYDILGREVATLLSRVDVQGSFNINFNAEKLASGVYFYQLLAFDPTNTSAVMHSDVKRMMLVK